MKKNIVLIGMRGCGKSHIGSLLANILGMPKIDIDEEIENYTQKTIPRIIETEGWEAFREYEHQIIQNACTLENVIIATGGGAITFERNAELLHQNGIIIFLFATLSELIKRLKHDTSRPALTQEKTKEEEIIAVWNERKDIYFQNADMIFHAHPKLEKNNKNNIEANAKILAKTIKQKFL